jgi:hypothetical protein
MTSANEHTANGAIAFAYVISFCIAVVVAIMLYTGVLVALGSATKLPPTIHWLLLLSPAPICGGIGYWFARKARAPISSTVGLILLTSLVAPFAGGGIVQFFADILAAASGRGL